MRTVRPSTPIALPAMNERSAGRQAGTAPPRPAVRSSISPLSLLYLSSSIQPFV